MADELKGKNVNIYIDDAPAREAYERLSKKADAYNKKIDEGAKKAETLSKAIQKSLDAGKSPEKLVTRLDKVNASLDKNKAALEKVTNQQKVLQQQMDNKTGPSLKSQQALVVKLENEYKNLGQNTEDAQRKLVELGKAYEVLNQMKDRLNAVKKAQDDAGKSNNAFWGSFFGNVAANLVAKASAFVEGFFDGVVEEALNAEESTARFRATLDNLGRSDAFDRIMNKADELAAHFRYLDNDDIVAVFNKLIDYGKLTEKQMNDLLPVIIDFAAKQRISIEESASVIIKALEGNGKALKEYGINVKDAKTEGERLNIVMTTLKDKVNGAGDAFMSTATGGIATAKQEMANLKEEIGNNLIPVVNNLLRLLNNSMLGLGEIGRRVKERFLGQIAFYKGGFSGADKYIKEIEDREKKEMQQQDFDSGAKSYALKWKNLIENKTYTPEQALEGLKTSIQKQTAEGRVMMQKAYDILSVEYSKTPLGTGDNDNNDDAGSKNSKKDKLEQERQRIANDQKKLAEDLEKSALSLIPDGMYKELLELEKMYAEWRELAHGNQKLLLDAEEQYELKKKEIRDKYTQPIDKALKQTLVDRNDAFEKQQKELPKKIEALSQKAIAFAKNQLPQVSKAIDTEEARQARDRLASLERDVLKAQSKQGKKRLEAELALLDEQESQALEKENLTQNEKLLIEEQYRQKRRDAELNHYINLSNTILSYSQQVLKIMDMFDQTRTAKENAELAKLQKKTDNEKSAHKRLLDNKLISQQEYNRRIAAGEDVLEKKRHENELKQFRRKQKAQYIQAIINNAEAVTKTLAEFGPPVPPNFMGMAAMAFTLGSGITNLIAISKQKPPEYAKGGYLNGPSHTAGGMPVINPVTGRKEAVVEGGEVILSKKTVKNNAPIVNELLYSSMYRNGEPIIPWFKTRTYKNIDYAGLTRSVQKVRYYENGGVMQSGSSTPVNNQTQQPVFVPAMTERQEQLMEALLKKLDQPFKGFVVYSDIQAAGDKLDQIKSDATFRKN